MFEQDTPDRPRRRVPKQPGTVLLIALLPAGLLGSSGCQHLVQRGWIAPPGPMNYQQAHAVVHDPFPQGDLGPDDHSMRPPDYQNPLPLPVRSQMKNQVAPWLAP